MDPCSHEIDSIFFKQASEISNRILQYKLLNCNATVVTTIKDGSVNIDTGLTRSFWNTLGGRKTVKGIANKEGILLYDRPKNIDIFFLGGGGGRSYSDSP